MKQYFVRLSALMCLVAGSLLFYSCNEKEPAVKAEKVDYPIVSVSAIDGAAIIYGTIDDESKRIWLPFVATEDLSSVTVTFKIKKGTKLISPSNTVAILNLQENNPYVVTIFNGVENISYDLIPELQPLDDDRCLAASLPLLEGVRGKWTAWEDDSDAPADVQLLWSGSDVINVLNTSGEFTSFNLYDGADSSEAQFEGDASSLGNLAVFNGEDLSVNGTELSLTLPSEYEYSENKIRVPMIASVSKGQTAAFKPVTGMLRVICKAVPSNAAGFIFKSDGSGVSGNYVIPDYSGSDVVLQANPAGETADTVRINFIPQVSSRDLTFTFPLPAGTYNDFTVSLIDTDGAVISSSSRKAAAPVTVEIGKLVEMSNQIQKLPAPTGLEFVPDTFQGNATKLTFSWPRVGDEVSAWNNKTYELMLYKGSTPEDCTAGNRVYATSVLRKTFNVDKYLVDGKILVSYSNLTPDTDYIFALRLYPQVNKDVDEVQNDEDGSRRGFAASDWVYLTAHTDKARTPKADLLFSMYFDNLTFGGDMPMRAYGFQPNNKQSAKPYYPVTSIYSNTDKVSFSNPDGTLEADLIHNNQYPHDFVQNESAGFGLNPSWYGDVYDGVRTRTLTVPAMDGDNNGGKLPDAWCGKSINPMAGMLRVGNNYSGELWTPKLSKIVGTRDIIVEFDAAVYCAVPNIGEAAEPTDADYFWFSCYNAGTVSAVSKGTVVDGVGRMDLSGTAFKMTHYTVTVTGATSDTQIKFESNGFNAKPLGRFYLDNIEVKYK